MSKPTFQDATLMLQLAQWGTMMDLPEANNWLWSDQFIPEYSEFLKKYPVGSEGWLKAAKLCNYGETVGTLFKHGLFNEELLFDWWLVKMSWDRLSGIMLGMRQEVGNPRLYENYEAMAKADEAFEARLPAMQK